MTNTLILGNATAPSVSPSDYDRHVPFSSAVEDSTGIFATNDGGVFTVTEETAGAYLVEISARFSLAPAGQGGTYRQAAFSVGDAFGVLSSVEYQGAIVRETPKVAGVVFLKAGDTFRLHVAHNADVPLSATGRLRLTAL